MPVFGPLAVKKMFPEMLDIAGQMILKWDRDGPDHDIAISDDFTIRLPCTIIFELVCANVSSQNGFRHYRSLWL